MEENRGLPLLRSGHSNIRVYLKYVNLAPFFVNLYWLDYEGNHVLYKTLRPRSYIDIDTFETHPWVATEIKLKRKMNIGGESWVYMPKSNQEVPAEVPNIIQPIVPENRRRVVFITLPVYSLKDCCLYFIKGLLISNGGDTRELNLPKTLLLELEMMVTN